MGRLFKPSKKISPVDGVNSSLPLHSMDSRKYKVGGCDMIPQNLLQLATGLSVETVASAHDGFGFAN